jgi:hypothetical protein
MLKLQLTLQMTNIWRYAFSFFLMIYIYLNTYIYLTSHKIHENTQNW